DAIDDSTSPSVENNEMPSNDITSMNEQEIETEKKDDTVFIDLSNYDTEEEDDELSPRIAKRSYSKMQVQENNMTLPTIEDHQDIVAPNKRRGLNKYLNFVNTADENTSAILEDESSDEEEGNIQNYIYPDTWSNINNIDEDGEDLYDSDMYSVRFVSDGDEDDSFINDGSTDYDTTDDEDSDDFF
ncbi:hypothetical protein Tco_0026767, partial [Tanacetum coccineum]